MVTSLAFIAYFLAGGGVTDEKIHLIMVNVDFERGWVLAVMAWSMLFWFAWRYWLLWEDQLAAALRKDIDCFKHHPSVVAYAERATGKKFRGHQGFEIQKLGFTEGYAIYVEWAGILLADDDPELGFRCEVEQGENWVILEEDSSSLYLKLLVKLILTKPAISSWFLPYVLFIFALVSSLASMGLPAPKA